MMLDEVAFISKERHQEYLSSENYFLVRAYQDRIRYIPLSNDFFIFNESTIPIEKIEQIALFSNSLKIPTLFGQFTNDSSYLETLHLLLNSSLETEHRYDFFERVITPVIKDCHHFLDVGPGTGELTKLFGKKFNEITAIDVSEKSLGFLKKENFGENKKLNKIQQSIVSVELPREHYNVAVISHVLYYIDPTQWVKIIHKLYDSVAPGGMLVVVLNGGLEKASLIKAFGGKELSLHDLVRCCARKFNTLIDFFVSKEVFYTLGIKPMLHIAGLHLFDGSTTATQQALTHYLDSNNKLRNNFYKLSIYQKFIIIYKK